MCAQSGFAAAIFDTKRRRAALATVLLTPASVEPFFVWCAQGFSLAGDHGKPEGLHYSESKTSGAQSL